MASSNYSWGIEIGAGAIKALKLEQGENGVNVLDAAIIPHPKVLSTPGIDQNDVLRVSLGALTSQFDLSKAAIAVSVPGHAAFARFAKLPPVEPKKVPAIVKFEAVQQIPFPLDQVEWDFQTFISSDSPDVEVGIFAITRDRIMERLTMLGDVGITPDFVTLSPIAAYNALAFDLQFSEKTPGTIILDVGTTSTDLVVAEAGRVWVRTFPIGGHQFTEALVNQFKLSYPKAEKLKREAEEGTNARHVFQAMRPVFTDLAQDVQRSIGYYQSLHKDAKLVRLIGIGSTFSLPGLRKYLKQQLSMDVYRLEEYKRLNIASMGNPKREEELKGAALQMATTYGLALQGLGLNAITANLMPTSVIRESMWKGKVKWFGVAAGIALVAGGGMFLRPWMDSIAVASSVKPAVIDQAISEAGDERKRAEEAKVIGAAETDFRAANMLSLLDSRAIHAFLIDDLGQMIDAAEAQAPAWVAGKAKKDEPVPTTAPLGFTLKRFETDYRAGAAPATPGADAPPDTPPEAVEGDPALAGQGRVTVRLTVMTAQPEALDFMIQTLDKWLRTNAKREGVPYEIVVGKETIFGKVAGTIDVGPPSGPVTVAGGVPPRGLPEGGGGDPRGQRGLAPRGARPVGDVIVTGATTEESGGASAFGPSSGGGATNADVERLAPLGQIKPVEPPGKRTTFELKWDVVILPPVKKVTPGGDA